LNNGIAVPLLQFEAVAILAFVDELLECEL